MADIAKIDQADQKWKVRCMYCGQKLAIKYDLFGKTVRCPKCLHKLKITKPMIETYNLNRKVTIPPLTNGTSKSFFDTPSDPPDPWIQFGPFFPKFLIPQYDEISLFSMAASLILLLVFNIDLRSQITDIRLVS